MKNLTERQRFLNLFDSTDSLAEPTPWPIGLFNLVEWLTWNTSHLLGCSKTTLWKNAITSALTEDLEYLASLRNMEPEKYLEFRQKAFSKQLLAEQKNAEKCDRYAPPTAGFASPIEAMRRVKYHSEDFLNKEFDVFMSLASDVFVTEMYRHFLDIPSVVSWYYHGNGGHFYRSANIDPNKAQIDGITYSPESQIVVANELKLKADLGSAQLLKYAWMFLELKKHGQITSDSCLKIFVIGESRTDIDWRQVVATEVENAPFSKGKWVRNLGGNEEVIRTLKAAEIASASWFSIIEFCESYMGKLTADRDQVELKLISGFLSSLKQKAVVAG